MLLLIITCNDPRHIKTIKIVFESSNKMKQYKYIIIYTCEFINRLVERLREISSYNIQ